MVSLTSVGKSAPVRVMLRTSGFLAEERLGISTFVRIGFKFISAEC